MSIGVIIGAQVAAVGILLFFLTPGLRRRWPRAEGAVALIRTAAIVVGIVLAGVGLSGGSTPMSSTPNPVPAQVTSVNEGYRLYQANCAACHGVDGNGGGPLAGTTAVLPPSLKAHLGQHTDGDLFYWITNGLPGGMPAWSAQISDTDRWNLVNYLRSINGQGPTAQPAAASPAASLALLLPVGFAGFFAGWFFKGLRRSRR